MPLFVLIVSAVLLLVNAFVSASISYFFGLPGWLLWQIFPGVLTLTFVVTTMAGYRIFHPLVRLLYTASAAWLGFLNYLFFASLACWAAAGAFLLTNHLLPLAVPWACFAVAATAAGTGFVIALRVRVNRCTIRLRGLPGFWQGKTVALVSDLHLGQLRGARFLRKILRQLDDLKPQAVLISGDLFDGSPLRADHLIAPWRHFSAPLGTFLVTGNHDEFTNRNRLLKSCRQAGIRVLDNERLDVQGLQLIGIHDSESIQPGHLRRLLRGADIDRSRPSILLVHQPAHPAIAEAAGVSLQLSGHTHGGQFWPWNHVVRRIYGPFARGLSRTGNLQVLTCEGTGTWGPPLRLGTRSEMVLITLENEPDEPPATKVPSPVH